MFIIGLGGGDFPLAIATCNRRTRTAAGSAAIAGFEMGAGYLFGTLGLLQGGTLFSATGGWTAMLLTFAFTGVLMPDISSAPAAVIGRICCSARPARTKGHGPAASALTLAPETPIRPE
ncbi:hypothetical protein [Arthrobacter sp. ISL-65]|uniref:hypothetical protein n=1 Tax=Arthrobacter sp. ISL-65 TaxID=2819112 RepID=UPI001BE725C0|nr:hypothetical protein [Arthrobacter sp. ISL-65]MBT2550530.1 hypothetical protein [Arthrobacter sp. ISL-65]